MLDGESLEIIMEKFLKIVRIACYIIAPIGVIYGVITNDTLDKANKLNELRRDEIELLKYRSGQKAGVLQKHAQMRIEATNNGKFITVWTECPSLFQDCKRHVQYVWSDEQWKVIQ
jgi:hypothetical protein